MEQNNANITLPDVIRMGEIASKSGFLGVRNADEAITLMLVAQSEGRHPMTVAKEYHVINGKPALRADAMLARFQLSGGSVQWKETTDQKVVGVFSHPQGGSVEIEWDMERAKTAGLGPKKDKYGNPNNWMKFPRQMLRARCISEGVRAVYPAVLVGFYTKEEVEDFDAPSPAQPSATSDVSPDSIRKSATATLKAAAEKAAAQPVKEVEAVPVTSPAEDVAAWIDEAREAADHGVTAEDLKAKAVAKFGGEKFFPPEVKAALLEIWNAQKAHGEPADA